jgi:glycerate 2-kinase
MALLFFAGGHPLPTQESFSAARAVLCLLHAAAKVSPNRETFCFFLISGGASAMLELPLNESISLSDTITFHRALIHSGATITEINSLRKHFSAIKGGALVRWLQASQT